MEWDNEKCLQLIWLFKEKAELWQPDHKYHHNKLKRTDAWEEIATKMEVPTESAKSKINSLLSSHRRERSKEESSKGTGKGKDEVYTSKWFAYEAMRFIRDKNKCKQTLSSSVSQDSHQETSSQVGDVEGIATGGQSDEEDEDNVSMNAGGQTLTSQQTNNITSRPSTSQDQRFLLPPAPKRKRKPPTADDTSQVDRVVDILQRSACDVYGEHVAMKLKTYEKKTQAIVQYYINQVLFDADMDFLQAPALRQPMSGSYNFAPPSPHHHNIQQQNPPRYATLHSPTSSVSSNASGSGFFSCNTDERDQQETSTQRSAHE